MSLAYLKNGDFNEAEEINMKAEKLATDPKLLVGIKARAKIISDAKKAFKK